jgi:lipopolysaccharide heptosyltransferase II
VAFALIATLAAIYRIIRPRQQTSPDAQVGRILVIRLDLLGDLVFSMPAVEALRRAYPEAHITMLTLPYAAPLARLYPSIDEVVAVDTNRIRSLSGLLNPGTWLAYRRVYRHLRGEPIDLCVSVHGRMASLCAFLSGARRTVGYAAEAYPFLLTDPVPGGRYRERRAEVEYVRQLAAHAGAGEAPTWLSVPVPERASEAVDRLLSRHGIVPEDRVVVVHAGSVHGHAKRWPPPYWSRFADELRARADLRVVLVGAASDAAVAREVMAGSRSSVVSLAGETDLEELVALIARADLVASGDSGPLHLAVALGRPLLAVYGPTDPLVYGPYNPAAPVRLHRRDLVCSPCYPYSQRGDCPLGDPVCMRLVTVHEMVESALELLKET